jgi:glycine oxidase
MAAVSAAVRRLEHVTWVEDDVVAIDARSGSVTATTSARRPIAAARVVVAAGAWTPRIAGLPRPVPVRPLKGQMLALDATPLEHAIMGDEVYLVPRERETLVGATVEEAGFDLSIAPDAIDAMHREAIVLCPELRDARVTRTWAGIRPATPDMLPIVGADPEVRAVLYAVGHSKNGILLAPATAAAMADLVQGRAPAQDLSAFRPDRWPAN